MDVDYQLIKKVLIFHPTIAPYRIDLFNDLYTSFDTKIALFFRNLKSQTFNYDEIEKGLLFYPDYFNCSKKFLHREIQFGFVKRLIDFNPDIVIVNEYNESFWATLIYRTIAHKKFKIISICDDSIDIFKYEGGLHKKARDIAMKYIDGVILCNYLVQKAYNKHYPKVETFVMPIIQDETNFFKDKSSIIQKAKSIIIDESLIGKRVYLYVGRISPEKNPLFLVKSFILEHDRNPENVLYIIGNHIPENDDYNDEIDRCIESYNASSYIRKIGRREGNELKAWFYAGQILVVPSTRESFGAVVNEALMCGDFVMLSSIAGSACLIDDSNGELIDVSSEAIDFSNANRSISLLTMDYIDKKSSKMNCTYSSYVNKLIHWINDIFP